MFVQPFNATFTDFLESLKDTTDYDYNGIVLHSGEGSLTRENVLLLSDFLDIRPNITKLVLREVGLTAETVKRLRLQHVLILDISENDFGDEGLVALSNNMGKVTEFSASECGISSMNPLVNFVQQFTMLDLSYNDITDEGTKIFLESLEESKTLENLVLNGNPLGDEMCVFLSHALQHNTSLIHLELTHTNIGDRGASWLANGLVINRTLTELILGPANLIGTVGILSFLKVLETNHSLKYLDLWIDHYTLEIHLRKNFFITTDFPLSTTDKIINDYITQHLERNRALREEAHERVRKVMTTIILGRAEAGIPFDVANLWAQKLWETRDDHAWWYPEHGGSYGTETKDSRPLKRQASSIQCMKCQVREPLVMEAANPKRVFCGSYCQFIQHYNLPDLRGK